MKDVFRYELDDFLMYVDSQQTAINNTTDSHDFCDTVLVMGGEYKLLIGSYIYDAELIDGKVVYFTDGKIFLDGIEDGKKNACIIFNDTLSLFEDNDIPYIDEMYSLGKDDNNTGYAVPLNGHIDSMIDVSKLEAVENLLDAYNRTSPIQTNTFVR